MKSKGKGLNVSTKHLQIKKASSVVFLTVAAASVVVSFSIVFLNILWGTSQFNAKVQDKQEETRDTLIDNLEVAPKLQQSFNNLEIGGELIPGQQNDKKNSEVVLDALPSKFDYPALVSSINNLAKTTSVSLSSVQGTDIGEEAAQTSNSPEPVEIPITVEVEGPYDSIKKFLQGIENSIRPLNVINMNLSGTDKNLRATVVLNTYYQPAVNLNVESEEVR